jgi:NAD(P) transhydrogenase subunit beta
MSAYLLEISYIIASISFIIGLKRMSHPDKARSGNLMAGAGMGLAIFLTILFHNSVGINNPNLIYILIAIFFGSVSGWFIAKKAAMTAMPQLVSFYNGMGGICAALISLIELPHYIDNSKFDGDMNTGFMLAVLLGLIIGSVSFSGSIVAWAKLDGRMGDIRSKAMSTINLIILVGLLGSVFYLMTMSPEPGEAHMFWSVLAPIIYTLFACALIYGVLFVLPIGGADMPVVISLLNSFTGLAAAMGGFLYDNLAMLTGGILVGSAGTILTILMCEAMNRSLLNVLIGAFGSSSGSKSADDGDKSYKEMSITDAGVLLSYSSKVSIVPGYGLAVAQAQQICKNLSSLLEDKGVEVSFAIHPVAGRMPGHMNVLLAEADVSYDKLVEMDDANSEMSNTDVLIVVGANDVVNPAAYEDESSPIYGMPVINALDAKNVIVIKRSMSPGYAGIDNDLFYRDNTHMIFGDAKDVLQSINNEIKLN